VFLSSANGLTSPDGLAFDSAGNLFVSSSDFNTIRKFTPGGAGSLFASGLSGPIGLAFDSAGNLYSANLGPYDGQNFKNGYIEKFTPSGTGSTFASDPGDGSVLAAPEFIAIIPEPSILAMLGSGLVSLLFLARRRRGLLV
jgi:hypothetical protein